MYIVSMERAWTYSSNHTKLQVFWKRWEESFCHSCHWSAFFAKVYDELWLLDCRFWQSSLLWQLIIAT